MGNQLLAVYYINFKEYRIYGCYDKYTPTNEFDFYDIYNEDGICLNEGELFLEYPSWVDIKEYIDEKLGVVS